MKDPFDLFEMNFGKISKIFIVIWVLTALVACAMMAGGAFVVYKILVHFGIL